MSVYHVLGSHVQGGHRTTFSEFTALTVNGERYREMLENFMRPAVEDTPDSGVSSGGSKMVLIQLARQLNSKGKFLKKR